MFNIENKDENDPVILYIIFRESLARRLTPGQIAAQAAHAATLHASECRLVSDEYTELFDEWGSEAPDETHYGDRMGFGTTLIGVVPLESEDLLVEEANHVIDPYVHFLDTQETEFDIWTCSYIMCRKSDLNPNMEFRLLRDEYLPPEKI